MGRRRRGAGVGACAGVVMGMMGGVLVASLIPWPCPGFVVA